MHFEFGGEPMDMAAFIAASRRCAIPKDGREPEDMVEYIARTRRYIEPRLDDIPMAWGPQHQEVPAWSPDLERAISLYIISDVIRTQLHKTEDKFQHAKDKLGNADIYELKRIMALIKERD